MNTGGAENGSFLGRDRTLVTGHFIGRASGRWGWEKIMAAACLERSRDIAAQLADIHGG